MDREESLLERLATVMLKIKATGSHVHQLQHASGHAVLARPEAPTRGELTTSAGLAQLEALELWFFQYEVMDNGAFTRQQAYQGRK